MALSTIPFPIGAELAGLLFISIAITGLIVFTDIRFHDDYVGVAIEVCHPDNQESLCQALRSKVGFESDGQLDIGKSYWEILQIQAITLAIVFAGFRALMVKLSRHDFDMLRIFVIFLWGALPIILFSFATVDVMYYFARGLDIPDQLAWLNNVGIFEHTRTLGLDPVNVERNDLLITFSLGIVLIILLFYIATVMYKSARLRTTMV